MKPPFPTKFTLIGLGLVILGVLTTPRTAHAAELTAHLTGYVNSRSVSEAVRVLDSATDQDTVTIIINSPGGEVDEGFKVIRAIHNTSAHLVVARIQKHAASMAADISIECDQIKMDWNAILFLHLGEEGTTVLNGSMVNYPPAESQEVADYTRWIISYMHHYDDRLLSKHDWEIIMNGGVAQISGEQLYARTGDYYKTQIHHHLPEYSYPSNDYVTWVYRSN